MKKTIKLTESDLNKMVKKIMTEQYGYNDRPITLPSIKNRIIGELEDMGYVDISPVIEKIHELGMKIMEKFHQNISNMTEEYKDYFEGMIDDLNEYND
jgi:hypothetical protein